MREFLEKCWYSLNYRMCMVEAYFAYNRGEYVTKAHWQAAASEWQRRYLMCGRKLV
jgi:hypothetical protein